MILPYDANLGRMEFSERTGLDPIIGVLHGKFGGKHGLVYDLMEPLRPIVDRKVLEFVQSRTFHPADFTLGNNGSCRLNPELARNLVRVVSAMRTNDFDSLRLQSQSVKFGKKADC